MAKLDEVLCPNNRILGLMKRIQQALSPSGSTSTTSDDLGISNLPVDTDTILERWDEVVLQLKRAHLHLFLISGFDGIELDSGLILPIKRHRLTPLITVDDDLADLLHVQDQKSDGTDGGGLTGSAWNTRDLNTVVTNEITGASLASNQITLPIGTYQIRALSVALRVNRAKIKLYDTTAAADVIIGMSEVSSAGAGNFTTASCELFGRFALTIESVLEIRHFVETTESDFGGGLETSAGVIEVYTDVQIKRIV